MFMIILTLVLGSLDVDYMQLGMDLANNGDINSAIDAFRKVTIADPDNGQG